MCYNQSKQNVFNSFELFCFFAHLTRFESIQFEAISYFRRDIFFFNLIFFFISVLLLLVLLYVAHCNCLRILCNAYKLQAQWHINC